MNTLKQINEFLESQPIALAGVSRNPKKFGYAAFKELKNRGMNILPVNPSTGQIFETKCYQSISSLPADTIGLIIMTKKDQTAVLVKEALDSGIKQIWIQQSSDTPEAISMLKQSGINFITGECILMHYKPSGVHKFHKALNKFFRAFPK